MITIRHLSKTFRIPHERKSTLFELIISLGRNRTYEEFYAIRNLNLTIKDGEFVGIIGNNGSGKSTLLKMIAGIITPSNGTVAVDGRVASFLELGAGFQSELTAKENLFLYGAIMGMSRREIEKKYSSIVSFAELENFMDTKLKGFSSGMKARLAFSIAVHSESDILIVDEALAVGDGRFRKKCYSVFERFKRSGKTILFVSHDMTAIKRFCTRVIYLEKGSLVMDGNTDKVISRYVAGKAAGKKTRNS